MTWIGATPTTGDFKKCDSITTADNTATYNLRVDSVAVYPQSSLHCLVQVNGINQVGGTNYNIVNDTIVFTSNLMASDVINQILILGNVNDIGTVSDDTVSTAKLQNLSVSQAKIAGDAINADKISDDAISEEHLDVTAITGHPEKTSIVDADKFLISDSAASGALKYIQNSNLGGGALYTQISKVTMSGTAVANSGIFDSTKYTDYLVMFNTIGCTTDGGEFKFKFYKANGTTSDNTYKGGGMGRNGSGAEIYADWNNAYPIIGYNLDSGVDNYSGFMYVFNPKSTTANTSYWGASSYRYNDDYGINWTFGGTSTDADAFTGFYWFLDSGGNFDGETPTVTTYGITTPT